MHSIEIEINSSRIFIALLSLVTLGGLAIIFVLKISLFLKIALILSMLFYSGYILWEQGLQRGEHVIKKIVLLPDSQCEIYFTPSQKKMVTTVSGESTITKQVCLLLFNLQGKRFKKYRCMVWPDAVGAKNYRALLIWLYLR